MIDPGMLPVVAFLIGLPLLLRSRPAGPHANTDLREVYDDPCPDLRRLRRARRPRVREIIEEADRRFASEGSVGSARAQDVDPPVAAGRGSATGEADLPPGVARPVPYSWLG